MPKERQNPLSKAPASSTLNEEAGDAGVNFDQVVTIAQQGVVIAFKEYLGAEKNYYLHVTEHHKAVMERARAKWQQCHKLFLDALLEVIKDKIKTK